MVLVAVMAAGILVSTLTPFGRNVTAIGGNEEAAVLKDVLLLLAILIQKLFARPGLDRSRG